MRVNAKTIKLQVDCGVTVCITPKSLIGETQIESCNVSLEMWNKVRMKALSTCKLLVENLMTLLKYLVKFVAAEENLTPLLNRKAAEKMELITVNHERFLSVNGKNELIRCLRRYPDIFNGDVGTLPGSVRLTLKPDAGPILHPPIQLPVELKDSVSRNSTDLLR